jgi:hypothetical protein
MFWLSQYSQPRICTSFVYAQAKLPFFFTVMNQQFWWFFSLFSPRNMYTKYSQWMLECIVKVINLNLHFLEGRARFVSLDFFHPSPICVYEFENIFQFSFFFANFSSFLILFSFHTFHEFSFNRFLLFSHRTLSLSLFPFPLQLCIYSILCACRFCFPTAVALLIQLWIS